MAHLINSDTLTQGAVLFGVDWGIYPNPLSIVLTCECDIIHEKASYIIVASLISAREIIRESSDYQDLVQGIGEDGISNNKWAKISKLLDNYIHNKGISRYYFIDPADAFDSPYLFVDFQHLQSVPFEDISRFEVVAKLPSPYKEQMIVQFASYLARIPVERAEDTTQIKEDIIAPLKRKL